MKSYQEWIWALLLFLVLLFVGVQAILNEETASTPSGQTHQVVSHITSPPQEQPIPILTEAKVTRVIDGDTIEVSIGSNLYKVRYIGIDTPETVHPSKPVECFGKEALNKNQELVAGRIVKLEKDVSETDKYGRLLRYVWVGDTMINAELVRLGYAQVITYQPDVKYQDFFRSLQNEARNEARGLWGETQSSINIQEQTSPPTSGKFVGSINSNKYHYPSCRYAKQMKPENEIWFSSSAEARAKGYVPCKGCNPP